LQEEKEKLVMELEILAHGSDKTALKFQEARLQKLKQLKIQVRCEPTKFSRLGVTRMQMSAARLLSGSLRASVALSSILLSMGTDRSLEK